MININNKIIFRRGEKNDLPEQLDAGEIGYATDDGTLVIGADSKGQPNADRAAIPYRNIEILTERSLGTFAKMHGDRMREGTEFDYYEARLEPDRLGWTPVLLDIDGDYAPYRIEVLNSVSAFIDYTVTENDTGEPIRDGQMIIWHHDALGNVGGAQFTDRSSMPRERDLTNPSNYDPRQVFEKVKFRFRISDDYQFLDFEYKNYTFDFLILQFRVSRPLDGGIKNVITGQVIISASLVGETEILISTEALWRIGGTTGNTSTPPYNQTAFSPANSALVTTQAFLEDGTGVYLSGRLIQKSDASNAFADLNSFYTTSTQYTTVPYISKFDKDGVLEWQKHIALDGPAIVAPLLGRTVTYTPMQMAIRDGVLHLTGNYVLGKIYSTGTAINFYTIRVALNPSTGDVISHSTHFVSDSIYGIYPIDGGEIWIAGYVILRRDLAGAVVWSASIQDANYDNYSYHVDGAVVGNKIYTLGHVNEMNELAVMCLDFDRNLLWSTTWYATPSLVFNSLATAPKLIVDVDGACYVSAVWYQNDEYHCMISKFSNTGVHQWSKRIITPQFYTLCRFTIDDDHITLASAAKQLAVVKLNKTDGSYFQRTMFSNLGSVSRVEAITSVSNGGTGIVYFGSCLLDRNGHVGVWRLPTSAWSDEDHRKYTVARMYTDTLETSGLNRFPIHDFDDNYQVVDYPLPAPTNTLTAKYGIGSYDGEYTEDPSNLVIEITDAPPSYFLTPSVHEREANRETTIGDYWTGVIQGIDTDLSVWDEITMYQVAVLPNSDFYAVGVLYIQTTSYIVVYKISKTGSILIKKKIAKTSGFTDPISCHIENDKLVIFSDTGYKLDLSLDLANIISQSQFSGLADNSNGSFKSSYSLPASYVFTGENLNNNIQLAVIDKSTNNVVLHKTLTDPTRTYSNAQQVTGSSNRLFHAVYSSISVANSTTRGTTVIATDHSASSILWQQRIVYPNTTSTDVHISSISCDDLNNVFVLGTTSDLVYTGNSAPLRPFFIMKLDPTGALIYCKNYKLNDFPANWMTAYSSNIVCHDGRLFCHAEIGLYYGTHSQDYIDRENIGMSFLEISPSDGSVLWARTMQAEEYHFSSGFFNSNNTILNIDPYDMAIVYARGLIHNDSTDNYITKAMRLPVGVGTEIDDDGINMWTASEPVIQVTDSEVATLAGTFVLGTASSMAVTATANAFGAINDDIRNQLYTFKVE